MSNGTISINTSGYSATCIILGSKSVISLAGNEASLPELIYYSHNCRISGSCTAPSYLHVRQCVKDENPDFHVHHHLPKSKLCTVRFSNCEKSHQFHNFFVEREPTINIYPL